jgi:asparagine synthase (glutamine-hydrolysing)
MKGIQTRMASLTAVLERAVQGSMVSGPVAIMFSGGLDSGLLAALGARHGEPHLYTVGMEGSHDLRMSQEAAAVLDLPWTPLVMTTEDVLSSAREVLHSARVDPVTLSFELPLQMIASRADERVLMSGQGADELFAGYDRYLRMPPLDLRAAMDRDLARALAAAVPLEDAIAGRYNKRVERPYLQPDVIELAASIPVDEHLRGGVRKAPLRDVAASLGQPLIASREKKAAQYGTGFMKVLRSLAKQDGIPVSEFVDRLGAI